MNKEKTNETELEGLTDWSFPDLANLVDPDEGLMPVVEEDKATDIEENRYEPTAEDIRSAELAVKEDELKKAQAKLSDLKIEYESGLSSLKTILEKLKNPLIIIEGEIAELIEEIIKKIAKKIIRQEIAADPKIIHNMIHDIKSSINEHNSMVNVFLSEIDFKRIDQEQNQPSYFINANPALHEGDILIKSNYTEIRGILDERITKLIRIDHE